jgi:hypothetical protein
VISLSAAWDLTGASPRLGALLLVAVIYAEVAIAASFAVIMEAAIGGGIAWLPLKHRSIPISC